MPIPPRPISLRILYLPATVVPSGIPWTGVVRVFVSKGGPGASPMEAAQAPQKREESGFSERHRGNLMAMRDIGFHRLKLAARSESEDPGVQDLAQTTIRGVVRVIDLAAGGA